jgi:hypothetical protein
VETSLIRLRARTPSLKCHGTLSTVGLMPRWLPLTVFVTGVVTGAVLWLWFGEGTRLAAAGCDRPYCPSATAIHNSRYFIDAGRALFVVALVALIVWAVRAFVRRQRGPKRRRPTLREW